MIASLISLETFWDSYIFRMMENTRVCMGKTPCLLKLQRKETSGIGRIQYKRIYLVTSFFILYVFL